MKNNGTVLFFEKGEMKIGAIKKKEGKFFLISTPDGAEKTISEIQVFGIFGQVNLQKVEEYKKDIDLQTLWEVVRSVPDLRQVKEDELISIQNPHFSQEELLAIVMKLHSKENIYFKNVGEGLWVPREENDVKSLYHKMKEENEKKQKIKEFRDWIFQNKIIESIKVVSNTDISSFFTGKNITFEGEINQTALEFLRKLRKFFINGSEEDIVKEAFGGIIELKRTDIFKLLVFFKVINPYENFFIEKFNINFSDCKLNVDSIIEDYQKQRHRRKIVEDLTYSIDVEGTEIRDDAISEPKFLDNETEILVHIADTSLLDREDIISEVLKRGKTIYFPEGKKDMLPEKAVKKLSLDAGVPKPAITFRIKFSTDKKIKINEVEIFKSEIFVRGNYEFSDDVQILQNIKNLGVNIHNLRILNMGGVDLISDDFLILVDDKGNFITERWKVNDMRIAVAEISMLCSHAIAWFCAKKSIPIFFRRSKIDQNIKDEIHRFNNESYKSGLPRFYMIWKNIRASRYIETTVEPSGAESLGYDLYAWGTSPLRRGWDFVNILQIGRFLEGEKLFSEDDLIKMKEKLDISISNVESAEDRRYKYILSVYLMREFSDKIVEATVVERNRETIYWVEDILTFLKGKSPKKADILQNVKVILKSDPLNLKIVPVPVE
ncbi:MAG: ribonuclease catalytic domain-containing protein [Candidatus Calescibacterium sp.]|nr:ribonuclease catalytic domain-containing protein [Candidatus Calescibacterium sp.]MDW8086648.1 RNB domain-containing ribonuclease [Candidatus Calescibacterium sp.]